MICENCGRPIDGAKAIISMKENEAHFFCVECATLFGTCAMCANTVCNFANDPDPMPQFVMVARQIRQGNATFVEQKQIPNADRIKRFCIDGGCKCFCDNDGQPYCSRYGGHATCTNYVEREHYNFVQDFLTDKTFES